MFDVFAATDSQTKCKIIVLTKDFFILILHIINITMKKTKLLLLVAASVLLINGKKSSHDSMAKYVSEILRRLSERLRWLRAYRSLIH